MKNYRTSVTTALTLTLATCLQFPIATHARSASPQPHPRVLHQQRQVDHSPASVPQPCVTPVSPVYPKKLPAVDEEGAIASRNDAQKGISVDPPKVYDDALLQQMLRSAEGRLASLQLIDQASILARLGAVSGATQQTSGVAFNVQGAPIPQTVTTTKLPTEATTAGEQTTAAGATSTSLQTVSNLAVQDVQTTRAALGPPTATVPAPTVTFPSGFSVASSDILNEQLQLTAEVNGLRLLLSGSLSDYFINTTRSPSDPELVKLKTTLGFSVSLAPDQRYKDAAAIVEVEVRTCEPAAAELPAVTAIIPREKTFNVAAISDSSTSIGGGVATQILGFSGSWVRGHKTYYLVQDQDTVASTYKPTDPNKTGFAWQFRPVLGRRYVKAGLKQTFVQLAFPTLLEAGAGEIGQITVRTYWRKYDRKTGMLKDIVSGSYQELYANADIRSFKEPVLPIAFNETANFEDLGGGQMLVKLEGKYLPGTYIRIGSASLTDLPRFKQEHLSIKFTATAAELATKGAFIVARDGREQPLIAACSSAPQLAISNASASAVDDSTSRLKVQVTPSGSAQADSHPKLYFVIGQRVFGDLDSPLKFESKDGNAYVSALVPNAVFTPTARLTVKTLLAPDNCISNAVEIGGLKPPPGGEKLVALEQGKTEAKFLLTGNDLQSLHVVSPPGAKFQDFGSPASVEKMRLLILPNDALKTNKQILFQRGEKSFLMSIPEFDTKKPAAPKALGVLGIGSDEIVIIGEGLSDVEGVTFREQAVTTFKVVNDQTLRLSGLVGLGLTASAGTQRVFLKFKSAARPVEVDIPVVNTIQSNQP